MDTTKEDTLPFFSREDRRAHEQSQIRLPVLPARIPSQTRQDYARGVAINLAESARRLYVAGNEAATSLSITLAADESPETLQGDITAALHQIGVDEKFLLTVTQHNGITVAALVFIL